MSDYTAELFFDYGPADQLDGRCDTCYAQDVVLKSMYRLSWSDWESGVERVGATIECTNCDRKVSSYWG
jgi:hypothetical protein